MLYFRGLPLFNFVQSHRSEEPFLSSRWPLDTDRKGLESRARQRHVSAFGPYSKKSSRLADRC